MATAQAIVTITVDGTAAAVDDSLPDVTAGTPVTFTFANLVVNDTVNGVPVEIGVNATFALGALTNPASGTLVDNGDGTGTFTPAAGYCGPVSFSYEIENICSSGCGELLELVNCYGAITATANSVGGPVDNQASLETIPDFTWGVTSPLIIDGPTVTATFEWTGSEYHITGAFEVPGPGEEVTVNGTACFVMVACDDA